MILSIIIPVYNEVKKIRDDITLLSRYLTENQFKGEIIISDDGSTDDTIKIASKTPVNEHIHLSAISDNTHKGKGSAVRKGILQSKGDVVLFMDSGSTVRLDAISKGLELIQSGACQMVLGSRYLPESIIAKSLAFYRRWLSLLFRFFIKLIFPSMRGVSDSQCGFKIFKGDLARDLYADSNIDGFLFDIEILMKAKKEGIFIQELPLEWTCDRDSRLTFFSTVWEVLRDSLKIRLK